MIKIVFTENQAEYAALCESFCCVKRGRYCESVNPDGEEISLLTKYHKEFIEHEFAGDHAVEPPPPYTGRDNYRWFNDKYMPQDFSRCIARDPDAINLTRPASVGFVWQADKPCHLELWRTDGVKYVNDPADAEIIPYGEGEDGYFRTEADNLFTRSPYAWKIAADDGSEESETFTFKTADCYPRAIFVEGAANIRDFGSLPTFDGRRLRQGMIYRGCALETVCDEQYRPTERGMAVLNDGIKIKTDLDLRGEARSHGMTASPIGEDVRFANITVDSYDQMFNKCHAQVKEIIELLADESNYPVYIHCQAGADRTGTLLMLISALMGVERKYHILDYNITSLSIQDERCWVTLGGFEKRYEHDYEYFTDDTPRAGEQREAFLQRMCELWLTTKCGVAQETVDKVKDLLTEK